MKFNVSQLLLGPVGEVREFDLDDDIEGLDPDIVPNSNLVGHVKFTRAGANILVQGHAEVDLELTCSRCAEAFVRRVPIDIEEEFEPSIDAATGRTLPGPHEDPALVIDKHNMLDLDEVVRQDLLLAMEDYPHCREDCAGLCPSCGKNLNEGECDCEEQEPDSRWAALAALRGESAEDGS